MFVEELIKHTPCSVRDVTLFSLELTEFSCKHSFAGEDRPSNYARACWLVFSTDWIKNYGIEAA